MKQEELFSMALGLTAPWYISKIEFKDSETHSEGKELHLYVEHKKGAKFEVSGQSYSKYDSQSRQWRHLNFFQHLCYLHCDVPRVRTATGHTVLVDVPWSNVGSSFTLLFEAYAMLMVKSGMSLSSAGRCMHIDGRRIGRIIKSAVDEAMQTQGLEQVQEAGLDETSIRKGHNYVTVLTDRKRKKVVGLGLGKDKAAVQVAVNEMAARGSKGEKVETLTIDLSPAYISSSQELFANAEVVFDRFHLDQLLGKAVDEVRREEQKESAELKNSRYFWLRNEKNLSKEKLERVHYLEKTYPRIGKAYRLKEQFKEIWNNPTKATAIEDLEKWLEMAWDSSIVPMQKFVNTINAHWYGVETYFDKIQTNAFAERVNLKIQEIKRIAKGYRNTNNLFAMIYFHLGGFVFDRPTK